MKFSFTKKIRLFVTITEAQKQVMYSLILGLQFIGLPDFHLMSKSEVNLIKLL